MSRDVLEREIAGLVAPALSRIIEDVTSAAVAQRLLPGVEVRIMQGQDGAWHASVLLDPRVYRSESALPKQGNRPLVDTGSGRWWYDLTASETVYTEPKDSPARTRSRDDALADLRDKVSDLLAEIALIGLRSAVGTYVESLPAPPHHRFPNG